MRDKFGEERNFTYCFTDSWSQTVGHIDDPTEQEHWTKETGKLWELTSNRTSEFSFRTIDDILEENAAQKEEIRWLNDVITTNISELSNLIQKNTEGVVALQEDVVSIQEGVITIQEDIVSIQEDVVSIDEEVDSVRLQ